MNPTNTKMLFKKLSDPKNPIIFIDIAFVDLTKSNNLTNNLSAIENESFRLYFELFYNIVPLTSENFRQFCTGENINNVTKKPYGYKNTQFNRLIKNNFIQGGDFLNYDGTGEYSIYGKTFNDENFNVKHNSFGILSMANSGPNTNGCQFLITLGSICELDNNNVAFGKVIDEFSTEILKKINEIPSDFYDEKPSKPISIINCGQM